MAQTLEETLQEWLGRPVTCETISARDEYVRGTLLGLGDGWVIIEKSAGHNAAVFLHGLVSIEPWETEL